METMMKKLERELSKFRVNELQTVARSVFGKMMQPAAIMMHVDRKGLPKKKSSIVQVCCYLYRRQKWSYYFFLQVEGENNETTSSRWSYNALKKPERAKVLGVIKRKKWRRGPLVILPLNLQNLAFFSFFITFRPSEQEVLEKIWLLQLFFLANRNHYTWYGAELTEKTPDLPPSLDEIDICLVRAYKKELRHVKVLHIEKDNFLWIMVIEYSTKSNNRIQYHPPVFFVIDTSQDLPYFFHNLKRDNKRHLDVFASALGYDNYESKDLSGKNVDGLFEMIKRKFDGTVALMAPRYSFHVNIEGNTYDYTGRASRMKYADQICAGGSSLSLFTIDSTNRYSGRQYDCHPAAKRVMLSTKLTIQCLKPNCTINDVIKELIIRGDMAVPAPSWVLNLPYLASNYASIQSLGTGPTAITEGVNHESKGNDSDGYSSPESMDESL